MQKAKSRPATGQDQTEVIVKKKAVAAISEASVKRAVRKVAKVVGEFIIDNQNSLETINKFLNRLDKRVMWDKRECKKIIATGRFCDALRNGDIKKHKKEAPIIAARMEGAEIYKRMSDYIIQENVTDEMCEIYFNEILAFIEGFTGMNITIEPKERKLKKAA